eukprot:CAMPEP_0172582904 /NCGR_PEP_ID=MMETSP1068-20121228/2473_1 /TAXON_ID=35684 /ORGANISM="Pseudopedinella elastica, Strain CCMP716" /LENGTH=33 /DNA_ID= /DNA_START= /DNA_END= /DNA_ORIENTATION=
MALCRALAVLRKVTVLPAVVARLVRTRRDGSRT